jgi:hypothetical protein
MKPTRSIALAMGVGYVLGRKQKLRTALLLGGAVATGHLGKHALAADDCEDRGNGEGNANGNGGASEHGMLSKLSGAGTAAARVALTKPMERLSTRLNESAEALRKVSQVAGADGNQPAQGDDRT